MHIFFSLFYLVQAIVPYYDKALVVVVIELGVYVNGAGQ